MHIISKLIDRKIVALLAISDCPKKAQMKCFNFEKKKQDYFEIIFDENSYDFILMLKKKFMNNLLWYLLHYVLIFSSFIIPII